ncbi:MAG TPA: peptidoglycan DD-metalloendopeptidase family protein [Candidatus Paceibacterota bacterium]|nr:peptidoglycan DD-metalloendopeptidase family protein [Candidatus Paceibacterota bacterium]
MKRTDSQYTNKSILKEDAPPPARLARRGNFYVKPLAIIVVVFGLILFAEQADASLFSTISGFFNRTPAQAKQDPVTSQNIDLLDPSTSELAYASPGQIEENALVASPFTPESQSAAAIDTYIVKEGDSISQIAAKYNVSVNTILWANNLNRSSAIKAGQELVILPINGITHIVKKGETLEQIVKKHKGDIAEVMRYNGLSFDSILKAGDTVLIPDGEPEVVNTPKSTPSKVVSTLKDTAAYFMRPLSGGTRTRGIHGNNGVDIGAPAGTPVYAAAAGSVVVSRGDGSWNGGYGNYVVITHKNGTQTLYAHLSRTAVSSGSVDKGEVIGYVGNTGKSTGNHLHFEVRGGKNPF